MENRGCRNTMENITKIKPFKIISRGAEAIIGLTIWINKEAVLKERVLKKYLDINLAKHINSERTKKEAKILVSAKINGIPVPTVYYVSQKSGQIIMEYIKGEKLKDVLLKCPTIIGNQYFLELGKYIARLHKAGMIHGDLTTSNIILDAKNNIHIIDFGLALFSVSEEDQGVEIHLLKRAIESTHWQQAEEYFESFINTYAKGMNIEKQTILDKIEEIESRGRYIEKR